MKTTLTVDENGILTFPDELLEDYWMGRRRCVKLDY